MYIWQVKFNNLLKIIKIINVNNIKSKVSEFVGNLKSTFTPQYNLSLA